MSVYGRLNYTQGYAEFDGADQLTANTINFLNVSNIHLNTWQTDDLANSDVGEYFYNPHVDTLANLVIVLNNFISTCNTSETTFTEATDTPNTLISVANSTLTSISNFLVHTNNLSGVTNSSNTALYPDLNSALAVGRQILNITNKTDSVQNNTPIMGNFTSLYVVSDIISGNNTIYNDYNILLNSVGVVDGNNTSNITDSQMNTFISDINSMQYIMNLQRNGDIGFYQNSLSVVRDYQTLLQFSDMGATQKHLIKIIGTPKLQSRLN